MLEEIRGYLMDRWARNRAKIEDYNDSILPWIKKIIARRQEFSRYFIARLLGDLIYEVRHTSLSGDKFIVDLKKSECSCRSWMLTGIPCYHAIACIQSRYEDPFEYIPSYYRKENYEKCYESLIYPTNGENLWELIPYPNVLPPPTRRAPGRPKKIRNKDADEKRKDITNVSRKGLSNKCSICGISGHNKSSCPSAPRQSTKTQTQTSHAQTSQAQISQAQTPTTAVPTVQSQTTQRVQTRQSQDSNNQTQPSQRVQTRQS
ncbi:uncharacterized protein LOC131595515 [Vicia villosa]|uniref:uncharacterized protein LOC131595515 n=1 Tax=Vicia villosa TaxID=3911 RepID=UPI00273B7CC6|nr:uncharacterized protein LOC131595515 [Vicia villosa]